VLAKAEREGSLREKIRFLCRFALLIVDEIGYLPVRGAEICSSNSSTHATKKAP
jgi:DNA replication protein DnaC